MNLTHVEQEFYRSLYAQCSAAGAYAQFSAAEALGGPGAPQRLLHCYYGAGGAAALEHEGA